jgi:hypothetical protein
MPNVTRKSDVENKSFVAIAKALLMKLSPKMVLAAVLGIALMLIAGVAFVLVLEPRVASIVLGRPEPTTTPPVRELPRTPEPAKTETVSPPAVTTQATTQARRPIVPAPTGNATVTGDNNTLINNSTVTGGVNK